MEETRKPPSERDVIERLCSGVVELPPLRFETLKMSPAAKDSWNVMIEAIWGGERSRFAAECRSLSTPKSFDEGLRMARTAQLQNGCQPMVVMPYLRDSQLAALEEQGISGIDLCGNGVVIVPDRFRVYRTGGKNQFPSYAPIKNVYRKNTSMVGRCLIAKPMYAEVQQLHGDVNARNILVTRWGKTAMGLSTVSKALKGMDDDLITERQNGVRLLQADKLLDRLSESYEPPGITRQIRMKINCSRNELLRLIREKSDMVSVPVVATGLSSVSRYAVMQRDDILSVYCPRAAALLEQLPGKEDDRFPNFELLESEEQPVYFDAREDIGFLWASPLQTWLELVAGDKRDRETAEQVRSYLLKRHIGNIH